MICTATYTLVQDDIEAGQLLNIAGARGEDADGNEATDTDNYAVPLDQFKSLIIDKVYDGISVDADGSGDVSVGDTLTYTITATNSGNVNLTNVVVTDSLITPTGGTTPCALVAPGGTCTLIGTYVVTTADVTAGSIFNTATADSVETDPVTDTETVPVPTPELSINKPAPSNADEDGSLDVSVGDTLTYTITATNTGTANLTNVLVSDPKITPSSTSCALLAPTETCVLVGTYVVTAADVTSG